MLSTIKKVLGLGCALCGSTLLVLSLTGLVGPGCGSGGGGDSCEAACKNYVAKCGSRLSLDASDETQCRSAFCSSRSRSSGSHTTNYFSCAANASTCNEFIACGDSEGLSSR